MSKQKKYIFPPFGFSFQDGGGVDIEDHDGLLSIFDGMGIRVPKGTTCAEMVADLKLNGFEVIKK